jgi:hypothetical protein
MSHYQPCNENLRFRRNHEHTCQTCSGSLGKILCTEYEAWRQSHNLACEICRNNDAAFRDEFLDEGIASLDDDDPVN